MMNEEEFRSEISDFLSFNIPQISMHGGESNILEANPDTGYVRLVLGGTCSGCGISPMTAQVIKQEMPKDIDSVTEVHVEFADQQPTALEDTDGDTGPQAPF